MPDCSNEQEVMLSSQILLVSFFVTGKITKNVNRTILENDSASAV